MLRFYFVIVINVFAICYFVPRMRYCVKHKDRYSLEKRYSIVQCIVRIICFTGRIKTVIHGTENLPEEGGYTMYANHQGRFDALGVMYGHKKPISVLMDSVRSQLPIASEVVDMTDSKRLNKENLREQVVIFRQITEELNEGRRYLIFPEGGYDNNKNSLQSFHSGSFKCAMRAKCPIVPVVLVDSYKVFSINTLRRVTNHVYFLPPIPYSEYEGLSSAQVSDMVYQRISDQLSCCV